jgi:hypothetical protein
MNINVVGDGKAVDKPFLNHGIRRHELEKTSHRVFFVRNERFFLQSELPFV